MNSIEPSDDFKNEFKDNDGFGQVKQITPSVDNMQGSGVETTVEPEIVGPPLNVNENVSAVSHGTIFKAVLYSSVFTAIIFIVITVLGYFILVSILGNIVLSRDITNQLSLGSVSLSYLFYSWLVIILTVTFFAKQLKKRTYSEFHTAVSTALFAYLGYASMTRILQLDFLTESIIYTIVAMITMITVLAYVYIEIQQNILNENRIVSIVVSVLSAALYVATITI
jgi:hypothetical protein